MTLWTFNLRSNDSDIDDDEENDLPTRNHSLPETHTLPQDTTQRTRQKPVNQELEELFGSTEDEESVEYKPNPWSIAKINANTRSTMTPTKSGPKKNRKSAGDSSSNPSGLEQFWKKSDNTLTDSYEAFRETVVNQLPNARKPLRYSISEALRRGGPIMTVAQDQNNSVQEQTDATGRLVGALESQPPGITLPLDSHQPLYSCARSRYDSHQEPEFQEYVSYKPSAYILDNLSTTPVFDESYSVTKDRWHLSTSDELLADSAHAFHKSVSSKSSGDLYTLEESSYPSPYEVCDEIASGDGFIHVPTSPYLDSLWNSTPIAHTPNRFRTASLERGPDLITQNQVRLMSPHSDNPLKPRLEPSAAVQLIARFAAPRPNYSEMASQQPEYSDPEIYREESPTFAWSPPSSTLERSLQYIKPNHRQVYPPHFPEHARRSTRTKQLSTPPRKKVTSRFEPDDKPFWSTLPTPPNSKLKPPTRGIKSSRFRLPGSFLGSHPLSGSSGRTLYKPPPRKRARSNGDEPGITKWKVIRMG